MRVEIVDVSEKSCFFAVRHEYIGKQATIATDNLKEDGFVGGRIYFDDRDCSLYFLGVKTKPIFDA